MMLEVNTEELDEEEEDDDDDDEDEDDNDDGEDEELVGATPPQQLQQSPFQIVSGVGVPQSLIVNQQPIVRSKTMSARKVHVLGRRLSATGQQQQQQGSVTRFHKVGVVRNQSLGGQGTSRLEPVDQQRIDDTIRIGQKKLEVQSSLNMFDGGRSSYIPKQQQQQQHMMMMQQQQHPVASVSLSNADAASLFQEQTFVPQGDEFNSFSLEAIVIVYFPNRISQNVIKVFFVFFLFLPQAGWGCCKFIGDFDTKGQRINCNNLRNCWHNIFTTITAHMPCRIW